MDILFYLKFWLSSLKGRKRFYTQHLTSIFDVDLAALKTNGISLLAFDVDDTLGEHKGGISEQTIEFLNKASDEGFKLAILSNCGKRRMEEVVKVFGPMNIYIEQSNTKPNPRGYFNVCNKLKVGTENAAMFGEKIGTDMYGAFLAGYKERILVKPYTLIFGGKKSSWVERAIRFVENLT